MIDYALEDVEDIKLRDDGCGRFVVQTGSQQLVIIAIALGVLNDIPHKWDEADEGSIIAMGILDDPIFQNVLLMNALIDGNAAVGFLVGKIVDAHVQAGNDCTVEVEVVGENQ